MEELLEQLKREQQEIRYEGNRLKQQKREYNIINNRIQIETDELQIAYLNKIEQEKQYNEHLNKQLDECKKIFVKEENEFKSEVAKR